MAATVYIRSPIQRNRFFPYLSDSLPITGISGTCDIVKPEKASPSQIPLAPIFSANTGINGLTMAMPMTAINSASQTMIKALLAAINLAILTLKVVTLSSEAGS